MLWMVRSSGQGRPGWMCSSHGWRGANGGRVPSSWFSPAPDSTLP